MTFRGRRAVLPHIALTKPRAPASPGLFARYAASRADKARREAANSAGLHRPGVLLQTPPVLVAAWDSSGAVLTVIVNAFHSAESVAVSFVINRQANLQLDHRQPAPTHGLNQAMEMRMPRALQYPHEFVSFVQPLRSFIPSLSADHHPDADRDGSFAFVDCQWLHTPRSDKVGAVAQSTDYFDTVAALLIAVNAQGDLFMLPPTSNPLSLALSSSAAPAAGAAASSQRQNGVSGSGLVGPNPMMVHTSSSNSISPSCRLALGPVFRSTTTQDDLAGSSIRTSVVPAFQYSVSVHPVEPRFLVSNGHVVREFGVDLSSANSLLETCLSRLAPTLGVHQSMEDTTQPGKGTGAELSRKVALHVDRLTPWSISLLVRCDSVDPSDVISSCSLIIQCCSLQSISQ